MIAGVVRIWKGMATIPLSHQICCDRPENAVWIYLLLPIQRLVIIDACGSHVPFSGSRNEILPSVGAGAMFASNDAAPGSIASTAAHSTTFRARLPGRVGRSKAHSPWFLQRVFARTGWFQDFKMWIGGVSYGSGTFARRDAERVRGTRGGMPLAPFTR